MPSYLATSNNDAIETAEQVLLDGAQVIAGVEDVLVDGQSVVRDNVAHIDLSGKQDKLTVTQDLTLDGAELGVNKEKIQEKLSAGNNIEIIDNVISAKAVQPNIDSIAVNGTALIPDENKQVNITIDKATVDLSNVDNTSDINKPVSTAQQAAIDAVDDKLNKDVVTDVTFTLNGDTLDATVNRENLSTGSKDQSGSEIISGATQNSAGLMTAADVKSLSDLQTRVGNLEGKTTRLLYTEKTDPTADEINTFVTGLGYTASFDGIAVVIQGTYHIWHYYSNDNIGWRDDGQDTVSTFTNDIAGIIKGAGETDGKIYAETDGTGSVYGWDALKTQVEENKNNLANKADVSSLDSKLDRVTSTTAAKQVYVKNADGSQGMVDITITPADSSMMQRDASGRSYVNNAVQPKHIVNLQQMNSAIAAAISGLERTDNKVTAITDEGSEVQYPSTKAVVDYVADHSGTTEITWADLKTKRDNSELSAGALYRITDYVCTTVQEESQSAGHQFDIIVRADDVNVLNENAWAALHEGDTYFANSKLDAWKLKYCLDNDTTRFAWADSTNGKGVIYYMKDEWDNECPYDFKNIQFKRYKITECKDYANLVDKYLAIRSLKFSDEEDYKYFPEIAVVSTSDTMWLYTFNEIPYDYQTSTAVTKDASLNMFLVDRDGGSSGCKYNKVSQCIFGYDVPIGNKYSNQWLNNVTFNNIRYPDDESGVSSMYNCSDTTLKDNCYAISFEECYYNTVTNSKYNILYSSSGNKIIGAIGNTFISSSSNNIKDGFSSNILLNANQNTFDHDCSNNVLRTNCSNNTFGAYCQNNSLSDNCIYNNFEPSCTNNNLTGSNYNSFGDNCYKNTLNNKCNYNTLRDNCKNNTIGQLSSYNTIGSGCQNNVFGEAFIYNTLGKNCSDNTIGINFQNNILGESCTKNTFGDRCMNNYFYRYAVNNVFGTDFSGNKFNGTVANATFGIQCSSNIFDSTVNHFDIISGYLNESHFYKYISYVKITSTGRNNALSNITCKSRLRGSSSSPLDLYDADVANKTYPITYSQASNGYFTMTWSEDGTITTGKYKTSASDATWINMTADQKEASQGYVTTQATTAETNAKAYADTQATAAETNAKAYADSLIGNVNEWLTKIDSGEGV